MANPAPPVDAVVPIPASIPLPAESRHEHARTTTVLVIDDDQELRAVFATALKAAGYSVVVAGSAEGADEIVKRNRPDVAVVDLMLPDMSGLELIHAWRTNWWMDMQSVPVIVLTGRSETEDCAAADVLGVSSYLIKPVEPTALVSEIRGLSSDRRWQVFRSPLTKLPGATAMDEEIARRQAAQADWAMLTVNIIGLHTINESRGYRKGDQAIRMLAAVLAAGHDPSVRLYHVSGDVFVEVMPPNKLDGETEAALQGFGLFRNWLSDSADAARAENPPAPTADTGAAAPGDELSLAGVALVVPASRGDLSTRELRSITQALMSEAKAKRGRRLVRKVLTPE